MQFDKGVIKRESLEVMVAEYQQACKEIDTAFENLIAARTRLRSAFGENYGSFDLVYHMRYNTKPEELKNVVKKDAWRALLERIEVKKFMSTADLKTLEKSFEDVRTIPEITLEACTEIITGMLNTAPDYAKKMAIEAYDLLTPGRRDHNKHKTNTAQARRALGTKVILTWAWVQIYSGGVYHANYGREKELFCIDKVFHALDGKGIPKGYNTPLVDKINTTPIEVGAGETDYFKFKCFQNGNLHLYFKRMDLVTKLNQIANDGASLTD